MKEKTQPKHVKNLINERNIRIGNFAKSNFSWQRPDPHLQYVLGTHNLYFRSLRVPIVLFLFRHNQTIHRLCWSNLTYCRGRPHLKDKVIICFYKIIVAEAFLLKMDLVRSIRLVCSIIPEYS